MNKNQQVALSVASLTAAGIGVIMAQNAQIQKLKREARTNESVLDIWRLNYRRAVAKLPTSAILEMIAAQNDDYAIHRMEIDL